MFKKITDDAKLPTRATRFSAGVDVYANEDVVIGAGETAVVGLGIAIDIEAIEKIISKKKSFLSEKKLNEIMEDFLLSHYIKLALRSSLGAKGLILPNGIGIIDLDYKDELKMIIHNPICFTCAESETDFIGHCNSGADDKVKFEIKKGDKIGQLLLMEHKTYLFGIESDEERTGGIGSTGKK